ncbi:MAG: glycosyl hydrolase [Prevotella sp.]|nr:glycosyl hydrolase [Prevotella sp.]
MVNKRKKKNKSGNSSMKWVILSGTILFLLWYYMPWQMLNTVKYDENWPYNDLDAPFSGGYDGVDISKHQGKIHWDILSKNHHIKFIYIKATEGLYNEDPCYKRNVSEAKKHGFLIGSYHFLSKNFTGRRQFNHFNDVVDKEQQDLLPIVDVEDDGTLGWSREKIQTELSDFIVACKEEYGKAPIIYCSESYFKDYLSPEFDNYILFIANYTGTPLLPGKPVYDMWQFSKKGHIPGIWNWVDLDKLSPNANIDDLKLTSNTD